MSQDLQVPLTLMDNADPTMLRELLEAVEEVARTGVFTGGEVVRRFEAAFADYCHTKYAVGASSGTEALILALRALGVKPGDRVIVPANSFVATAEAVSLCGAVPQFADVDAETQLMTAETMERAAGARVCGVIPVHLFGRTADLEPIVSLARRWGAWVIEDCAQAHGARYGGRPVGSWGDAGTFSFYPAKNLGGWGDGGAVVSDRADIAERVRLLRSHGEQPRYHHRVVGTTGRLDAVQAAVLERKLLRLEGWNAARRRVAAELREAIGASGRVALPPDPGARGDHVYHQFVVRSRERDLLREHLARADIASAIHYPIPIHRSEAFRRCGGGPDVAPTATRLAQEVCSLPIFPGLSASQIARVGDAVRGFAQSATHGRAVLTGASY
jgi:dTDP-3-amino-3,4,6-trideoxy-alpha-D-glucose transaminase